MKSFLSIIEKIKKNFSYFLFILFLNLIFFPPFFLYLQLPKKLNLKFFSIFDFFFKIFKIYNYFFDYFNNFKIEISEKYIFKEFIKNNEKKIIFFFKLNSFDDFMFSFFFIENYFKYENFLYLNFLNINDYNFIFRNIFKNINEIYFYEKINNKEINMENVYKIKFFIHESELEKTKLNFENYKCFFIKQTFLNKTENKRIIKILSVDEF